MSIVQPANVRTIQEAQYGSSKARLTCWPELDGALVNPDSGATVTIYGPGGAISSVSGASVTEAATYALTYDLDLSSTGSWPLGEDYAAEFTFVSSTLTYVRRVLFDVVLRPLLPFCPLRVDDLKNSHASIDSALSRNSETDAHQRYILPAWVDVLTWVRSQGRRPALIIDPVVLYKPTLTRALELYWRAHITEPNDVADNMARHYADQYSGALSLVVLKWSPEDGRGVSTTRGSNATMILIGPDHGGGA